MKKYFLLIAAAATVFAVSCRKAREVEQVTTETPQEEIDDTTPQPVRFGSSLNIQVETKAAIDKFAGTEDLYVWGFERVPGATRAADKFLVYSNGKAFINNVKAASPVATNEKEYHPNKYGIDVFNPDGAPGEYFYYTEGKVYDFVAYYLGDAHVDAAGDVNYTAASAAAHNAALPGALNYTDPLTDEQATAYNTAIQPAVEKVASDVLSEAEATTYNATLDGAVGTTDVEFPAHGEVVPEVTFNQADTVVTKVVIPVTIDGTNDIMLAKTDFDFDVQNREDDSKYVPENKMYSAYSSRRTVIPNLKFEHQLSRFIIKTKKGGVVPVGDINIKSISIKSKAVGDLYLYGTPSGHLNFEPGDNAADVWFPVKEDDGAVATGHPGNNVYEQLGESIMTFSGNSVYKGKLQIEQAGVSRIEPLEFDIDVSALEAANGGVAVPGHMYTVNLIVYGAEKVEVTVSLSEWVNMGNVDIDPDEDEDDNRTAGVITLSLDPAQLTISKATGASDRFTITANGGVISATTDPVEAGIALVPVAATYYDVAGAIAHNAGLTGALNSTGPLTSEQADAYNAAFSTSPKAAGDTLTAEEAAAYNATLAGAVAEGDLKEPAGYKVTVAGGVANGNYTLTVHSAGTFTVKPADATIAITVTD